MPIAARLKDNHTCPMVNPNGSPHTGGPILAPVDITVLIGGAAAATMGSMCTCTGPPDSITVASKTVIIGGKGAARVGDKTAHGGVVAAGCSSVIIGD